MQSVERQYITRAKPEIVKLLFDKSGRPRRIPLSSTQIEIALENPFSYWIVLKALKEMVAEGTLNRIEKRTRYAGTPAFYYPRKLHADIDNLHKHVESAIVLMERYSHPDTAHILGAHLEALVKCELPGFSR